MAVCNNCPKELKPNQKKYCSHNCQLEYQSASRLADWLAGKISGSDAAGDLRKMFRNYLINEAGNRCPECKWSEKNPYTGQVTLTIDHIDGDAQNNARSNLVVLCYNCHTLTPTFNQLNRGRGTRKNPPGSRRYLVR